MALADNENEVEMYGGAGHVVFGGLQYVGSVDSEEHGRLSMNGVEMKLNIAVFSGVWDR